MAPTSGREIPKQVVRESCSKGEVGGNSFLMTEDKILQYWVLGFIRYDMQMPLISICYTKVQHSFLISFIS